jgi:hypothetical protein
MHACEARINSFPNYTSSIQHVDGSEYDINFAALFSEWTDAVPVVFLHNWPGRLTSPQCEIEDMFVDWLKPRQLLGVPTYAVAVYDQILAARPAFAYCGSVAPRLEALLRSPSQQKLCRCRYCKDNGPFDEQPGFRQGISCPGL